MKVMCRQCGAERTPGVTRGRLDPDPLEFSVPQDLAVSDAIECHAARKAEIFRTGVARNGARHPQDRLFGHRLDGCRHVHVLLVDRRFRLPRRSAHQCLEAAIDHPGAGAVSEVVEVEAEGAVFLKVHHVFKDVRGKTWFAVGRESHEFVFPGIHLEPAVLGERGIHEPERMREMDLLGDCQGIPVSQRQRGRGPLADPVNGQDRSAFKGRREVRARGVAEVVFAEEHPLIRIEGPVQPPQFARKHALEEQLVLQPCGH